MPVNLEKSKGLIFRKTRNFDSTVVRHNHSLFHAQVAMLIY
jgi:hypothetical protein